MAAANPPSAPESPAPESDKVQSPAPASAKVQVKTSSKAHIHAQMQAWAAELEPLLLKDRPALATLLERIGHRLHRKQPADRLLAEWQTTLAAARNRADQHRAGLPVPQYANDLPIHAQHDALIAALQQHPVVIVCGETGSGKTTQLPKLCLEAGSGQRGMIGHTQPRRIAARSVATRIAEELATSLGARVGYKVRFGDQTSDETRIKLMTDGILLAELRSDPDLLAYDTLIIDEAHERSLNIDLLLGYLKRLQPRRPDLRLVITSATLDPERFAAFFGSAPILEIPGRSWPVEVRYRPLEPITDEPTSEERDLFDAIVDAVAECCRAGAGDILVFLPGEREIRDAALKLRRTQPAHTEILPLYARLSASEQARVFKPHPGRRIVLATNVAETALTVPGIRFVIDTGLARISRYSWRSRVQRLSLEPISQAAANQRAGRCGRLGPGLCLRLYAETDFALRPAFTDPEILRSNLAAVILQMAALNLGDPRQFPFLDPPDPRLVRDGYRLLEELHAVDGKGRITARGRQLAQFPIDPRFAAMIVAASASERGALTEVLSVASFLALQDPRERPAEHAQAADEAQREFRVEGSDFLSILKLWTAWHQTREELGSNALKRWCREHFLAYLRMREWQELRAQLATLARNAGLTRSSEPAAPEAIHKALLAGLVSHVGRKTERGDYLGTRNRRFQIHPGSGQAKRRPDWLMAAEIAETTKVYAREVATIQPEWLLEVAPHLLQHHIFSPQFQARSGRVNAFERITLYGLVVAAQQPVNFARHDPLEARRLFIEQGLIAGELRSRSPGYGANLRAVAEITELEARGRRRDLLAEEDRLRAFYQERLPPDIVDGPSFEAWSRKAEREDPQYLCIDRATLLNQPAQALPSAELFPDSLSIGGIRLPLSYRFEPGAEDDGVTARVPIAALNSLPDDLGEWLVPGLLEARVTGLLRSLPKSVRRHFVPAPDFARAALERLEQPQGPLLPALARVLEQITGTPIPADAWQPERLEPHLQLRFCVLDPDGAILATGRNLSALKRQLGASAGAHFAATRPEEIARSGITRWDFGDLPEFVEFEHQGAQLRAYPALVDHGEHVALNLESDPETAHRHHRAGLRRLFLLQDPRKLRDLKRQLPDLDVACLHYAALGTCAELRDRVMCAAADRVFLSATPWPRTQALFAERLAAGQVALSAVALELAPLTAKILGAWHDLRQRLSGDLPLSWIEPAKDIQDQLSVLISADFLEYTPADVLPELPRYLLAIERRLERLTQNPEKDRRLRVDIEPLWVYIKAAWQRHPEDTDCIRLRYRFEELRVSVFAQALGTREKVSITRLAREFDDLRRTYRDL